MISSLAKRPARVANKITMAVAKVTMVKTRAAKSCKALAVLSNVSRQRPCVSSRAPGAMARICADRACAAGGLSALGVTSINNGKGMSSPILPAPSQGSNSATKSSRLKTRMASMPGAARSSRNTLGNCSCADKVPVSTICTESALVARVSQRSAARSAKRLHPKARQAKKVITIVTALKAGPARLCGGNMVILLLLIISPRAPKPVDRHPNAGAENQNFPIIGGHGWQ